MDRSATTVAVCFFLLLLQVLVLLGTTWQLRNLNHNLAMTQKQLDNDLVQLEEINKDMRTFREWYSQGRVRP